MRLTLPLLPTLLTACAPAITTYPQDFEVISEHVSNGHAATLSGQSTDADDLNCLLGFSDASEVIIPAPTNTQSWDVDSSRVSINLDGGVYNSLVTDGQNFPITTSCMYAPYAEQYIQVFPLQDSALINGELTKLFASYYQENHIVVLTFELNEENQWECTPVDRIPQHDRVEALPAAIMGLGTFCLPAHSPFEDQTTVFVYQDSSL